MAIVYNIYCDESCHLEHDKQKAMVLGAVWCSAEKSHEIATRIREIKIKSGLAADFEIKWIKVSESKQEFYLNLLDYFFDDNDLHFRALVIPDKSILEHEKFHQDHDTWYYKMYFEMLRAILNPEDCYRVYIDIKDSHGGPKVAKLQEVLANSVFDLKHSIVQNIQIVRSHEIEQMQLADLLIGAVSYVNRDLLFNKNNGKISLVDRMQKRSGYSLMNTTLYRENKVNIFSWKPSSE